MEPAIYKKIKSEIYNCYKFSQVSFTNGNQRRLNQRICDIGFAFLFEHPAPTLATGGSFERLLIFTRVFQKYNFVDV